MNGPMKRADIKPCACCGRGVAAAGPTFYALQVRYFVLDPRAIQCEHGLEQHFGGGGTGAALASIMGTNPDLAQPLGEATDAWICLDCAIEPKSLAMIAERAAAPACGDAQ